MNLLYHTGSSGSYEIYRDSDFTGSNDYTSFLSDIDTTTHQNTINAYNRVFNVLVSDNRIVHLKCKEQRGTQISNLTNERLVFFLGNSYVTIYRESFNNVLHGFDFDYYFIASSASGNGLPIPPDVSASPFEPGRWIEYFHNNGYYITLTVGTHTYTFALQMNEVKYYAEFLMYSVLFLLYDYRDVLLFMFMDISNATNGIYDLGISVFVRGDRFADWLDGVYNNTYSSGLRFRMSDIYAAPDRTISEDIRDNNSLTATLMLIQAYYKNATSLTTEVTLYDGNNSIIAIPVMNNRDVSAYDDSTVIKYHHFIPRPEANSNMEVVSDYPVNDSGSNQMNEYVYIYYRQLDSHTMSFSVNNSSYIFDGSSGSFSLPSQLIDFLFRTSSYSTQPYNANYMLRLVKDNGSFNVSIKGLNENEYGEPFEAMNIELYLRYDIFFPWRSITLSQPVRYSSTAISTALSPVVSNNLSFMIIYLSAPIANSVSDVLNILNGYGIYANRIILYDGTLPSGLSSTTNIVSSSVVVPNPDSDLPPGNIPLVAYYAAFLCKMHKAFV